MLTILKRSPKLYHQLKASIWQTPHKFFLYFCAPISIILIFVMPPFQAPDEYTHFYKAVWMSYGHIKAVKFSNREVGAPLPSEYKQTVNNYGYMWLDSSKRINPTVVARDITHPKNEKHKVNTLFENTAVYPPLGYLPQTLAILITRLTGGSVIVQAYAARIFACLTASILVIYALQFAPFGKWAIVGLAATPLSLMLIASSANDAITFGISLLWVTMLMNSLVSRSISRKGLLCLYLLVLALGLSKAPYGLLGLAAFVIPNEAFRIKSQATLIKISLAAIPLCVLAIWSQYTKDIYITTNPAADTGAQLHYVLSHLIISGWLFTNTLFLSPVSDYLISQFINTSGWLAIRLPTILVVVYYIVLAFLLLIKNPAEAYPARSKGQRLFLLALGIIGSYSIIALIYLSFNPVGTHEIIGINSRYFIPFCFLLVPALGGFTSLSSKLHYKKFLTVARVTIIGTGIASIIATAIRFYAA